MRRLFVAASFTCRARTRTSLRRGAALTRDGLRGFCKSSYSTGTSWRAPSSELSSSPSLSVASSTVRARLAVVLSTSHRIRLRFPPAVVAAGAPLRALRTPARARESRWRADQRALPCQRYSIDRAGAVLLRPASCGADVANTDLFRWPSPTPLARSGLERARRGSPKSRMISTEEESWRSSQFGTTPRV
jgi:hypothetical protein